MNGDLLLLTGVPHLSSRDDVYNGYFIPKGQIDFQLLILFIYSFFLLGIYRLIISFGPKGSTMVANAWQVV